MLKLKSYTLGQWLFSGLVLLGALEATTSREACAQQAPEWEDYTMPDGRKGARLKLHQQGGGAYSSHDSWSVSVQETSLELILENADVRRALNNLEIPRENVEGIIGLNIRISEAPYTFGRLARNDIKDEGDERVRLVRKEQSEQVRTKILAALNANPQYQKLSEEQKKKTFDSFYGPTMKQVDARLKEARQLSDREINRRFPRIQFETALQEVALVVGKVLGNGRALVFVRAGKFHIENGASVDDNGQTEMEALRAQNNRVQRAAGSMGTGAIDLGWVQKINDELSARTDVFIFSSRIPHISAQDDIGTILALPQNEYEEHIRPWQLDSVAFRTLLKTQRLDVYFGAASHDGDFAANAGVTLRITPDDTVFIDGYTGQRDNLRNGASILYAHRLTRRVSVYAGYSHLEDSYEALLSPVPVTYDEYLAGVAYNVVEKELKRGGHIRFRVTAEVAQRHYRGDSRLYDDGTISRVNAEVEIEN